ncbi:hypothetical protein MBCUT_13770 [Methanobrevibacter cuticularis]|uniref:Uncharacterized protein n=1 Tax=Methanobrevibacter cuticularis TaxID=47311 RepID=A0A166DK39_9EURY|nr:hypothetical protein [Methanobrevibacter cuticularis]KZX15679.1 hypothetical protein MBCUT_13770 [Methanobrevibacter cuticularis]
MKDKELMKKCESCDLNESEDLMDTCKSILNGVKDCKEDLGLSDDEVQTYLKMVENLKPKDVSKVLALALKIRESGKIKNPEIKNDASRLIRAIEMS